MTNHSIGIIGLGCIGSYICHLLDNDSTHVYTRDGIPRHSPDIIVDNQTTPLRAQIKQISALTLQAIDLLIIPVKSYQNAALIAQLKHTLPDSTAMLILQNGIAGLDDFCLALPDHTIYWGISTDGLFRNTDGYVELAGNGHLLIGNIQRGKNAVNGEHAIQKIISQHPHGQWTKNIRPNIYKKLLINSVINPLTFIYECKNGELITYHDTCTQIIQEVLNVFRCENIDFNDAEWSQAVYDVISTTAENTSSMLQDKLSKKPTEIDAILGPLIKKAALYEVETPIMQQLYIRIKQQEATYLT